MVAKWKDGVPARALEQPHRYAYIYIFQCERFVKIGYSEDVAKRGTIFDKYNPFPVRLVLYRRVSYWMVRQIERTIHASGSAKRVKGEWFEMTPDEAKLLVLDEIRKSQPEQRSILAAAKSALRKHESGDGTGTTPDRDAQISIASGG